MGVVLIILFLYGITKLVYASDDISLALKQTAQSSVYEARFSHFARDGNNSSCASIGKVSGGWWAVDLQDTFTVKKVTIYNGFTSKETLDNLYVEGFPFGDPTLCGDQVNLCGFNPGPSGDVVTLNCPNNTIARYIKLRGGPAMTICEVNILGQVLNAGTCKKWNMTIKKRTKVVRQGLNIGTALSPSDCMTLCQQHHHHHCNIFNFNVMNGSCVVPTRPLWDNSLKDNDDWHLYYEC